MMGEAGAASAVTSSVEALASYTINEPNAISAIPQDGNNAACYAESYSVVGAGPDGTEESSTAGSDILYKSMPMTFGQHPVNSLLSINTDDMKESESTFSDYWPSSIDLDYHKNQR